MKKILFLIDSLNGGGAERALLNLVKHLDSSKYEIYIRTLYGGGIYENQLPEYVRYSSCKLKSIHGLNYFLKFFSPKLLHELIVGDDEYDLEIAFLEGITTKIISGANEHVKKVAWVRIDVAQHHRAEVCYVSRRQLLECYKRMNKIAFVGNDALNSFKEYYGIDANLSVIRNIFDYRDMLVKSNEACDLTLYGKPILVSVGRLEVQKGYDQLINVHRKLLEEGYEHTILILGEGSQRKNLESQIRKWNLEKSILLLGFKENPFKYMKNADWYLSTSRYEGFSSVIREAVILGKPIIATECSGVKEVIGDKSQYGVLMENSEQGIYVGIKKILEDASLKYFYTDKINQRKHMFNYEKTIADNQKFIASILGEEE